MTTELFEDYKETGIMITEARRDQARQYLATLHEGPYTSLGSYTKVWIDLHHGSYHCHDCARAAWRQSVRRVLTGNNSITAPDMCEVHWEGAPVICEECSVELESSYGDPDDH